MAVSSTDDIVRFGLFELDLKAGQLSRNGTKVRLPQQPLQLLAVLLERRGEVLTREELRQRLWPSDVFIDFDHGLNKSIQKLRDALGDSADSPRYIETIPRVGYRFIAPANGGIRLPEQMPNGNIPVEPGDPFDTQPVATGVERGRARWFVLAACTLVVAIAAGWFIHGRLESAEPIRSLAVLPLDNLSGDPGQNYLADGMTDELTTMLAKNSTLRITSRTSVMQYKGVHRPLREIARELGVDSILEGSVARSGDKVHMTIQLIRAPSDTHVWADSYDRDANDAVTLPMEAAQAIAKRLKSTVPQATTQRYVNPEAHDAYLRGKYVWYTGDDEKAGEYFKKAIMLQPDYALGWSGLADYYGEGALDGDMSPEDSLAQGEAAARKAVELDDSLPEAHVALGAMIFIRYWDWAAADREMDRAIELNPQFAEAYHFRAKMLNALNRSAAAIEAEKKAQELDPFQRPFAMAYAYLLARQYDAAIKDARSKLETRPEDSGLHWVLWETYRRKGDGKDAAEELEKMMLAMGNKSGAENVRRQYEQGGYKEVTRAGLEYYTALSSKKYVSPVLLATRNAELGNWEAALTLLEQAYRHHSPELLWIQTDPTFDSLHGEERYRAIIKGLGLPSTH